MKMAITEPNPKTSDNRVDKEHDKVELRQVFVNAQLIDK